MDNLIIAVTACWPIIAACTALMCVGFFLVGRSSRPAPEEEPRPVAKVPTHGPWADHHINCRCNVCK